MVEEGTCTERSGRITTWITRNPIAEKKINAMSIDLISSDSPEREWVDRKMSSADRGFSTVKLQTIREEIRFLKQLLDPLTVKSLFNRDTSKKETRMNAY